MDILEKICSKNTDETFEDYLFFDIEVFKFDSLVVFKNYDKETVAHFWNGEFEGIDDVIKDKILVGYNNYSYDDYVLECMRRNRPQSEIKRLNDDIIENSLDFFSPLTLPKNYISLDCMQQLGPGGKRAQPSLKRIEANLGKSIIETQVDFNIDRPLTEEERVSTLKYCEYDVESTIDIFKLRYKSYFFPKFNVISMLDESIQQNALRWNTTTIAANVLTDKKIRGYAHHELLPHKPDVNIDDSLLYKDIEELEQEELNLYRKVPEDVVDVWGGNVVVNGKSKKKITHDAFGCTFEFGFGGLHGVNNSRSKFENVYLLDVTSMYPNILIYLGALGVNPTKRFGEILEERIAIKHTNPVKATAYKLILNSVYGQMKNKYSKLFNSIGAESVCIYGQIALYDLCNRLYDAGYTLINANTDGIAFNGFPKDQNYTYEDIVKQWEEEFYLKLELSTFKHWIQKDVNNYIAIDQNDNVKVKGADVNGYLNPKEYNDIDSINFAGTRWNSTNSIAIVDHCLVNKLLYNKEPYETVLENLDYPLLFQMVLHTGIKYKDTIDLNTGEKYQKVNRIFAAKENVPSVHLIKQRNIDGKVNTCTYANAPDDMYVYNGDLSEFNNFSEVVDLSYYIDLADKAIQRWNKI